MTGCSLLRPSVCLLIIERLPTPWLGAVIRTSLVSSMFGMHTDFTNHCSVQAQVDSFWARIDANEAACLAESQMPAIPEDSGGRIFSRPASYRI